MTHPLPLKLQNIYSNFAKSNYTLLPSRLSIFRVHLSLFAPTISMIIQLTRDLFARFLQILKMKRVASSKTFRVHRKMKFLANKGWKLRVRTMRSQSLILSIQYSPFTKIKTKTSPFKLWKLRT